MGLRVQPWPEQHLCWRARGDKGVDAADGIGSEVDVEELEFDGAEILAAHHLQQDRRRRPRSGKGPISPTIKRPPLLAGVDMPAGQRLGARYLSERRVRRTRAVVPWSAASGR